MSEKINKYYVYEWYIVSTGEVFYVGKGSRERYKVLKKENKGFMKIYNAYECDVRIICRDMSEEEAFNLEIETIEKYRKINSKILVNVLDGGNQPPCLKGEEHPLYGLKGVLHPAYGYKYTEQDKKKVSEGQKKYLSSEKGKKEKSSRSKKVMSNPEVRQKISNNTRAFYNDEENRKRHSEIMKNVYNLEGTIEASKRAVVQLTLQGEYIATFNSIKEASISTGASSSHIGCVCVGRRKQCGGFKWMYLKDYNDKPR